MIRVIIEREINPSNLDDYFSLIRKAKRNAGQKKGFMGGELYQDTEVKNKVVIIATWDSIENWFVWVESEERKNLMNELNPFLEKEERVMILKSGIEN